MVLVGTLTAIRFVAPPGVQGFEITVGVLPDQREAVLRAKFNPLIAFLNSQTRHDFKLLVPRDYGHLVSLFESGEIDLAYFGGLTFVQAQQRAEAQALVMREVDARFTTSFVARNESPWNTCQKLVCKELAGTVLSFGSKLSTSGHLMPRFFLREQLGIEPELLFGEIRYSGGHDKSAIDVLNGTAVLGALNFRILAAMLKDGRIGQNELVQIWETPPYPNYVWAVRRDLDQDLVIDIRNLFLGLSRANEEERRILDALQAEGFLPASLRDFETLSTIAAEFELLEER